MAIPRTTQSPHIALIAMLGNPPTRQSLTPAIRPLPWLAQLPAATSSLTSRLTFPSTLRKPVSRRRCRHGLDQALITIQPSTLTPCHDHLSTGRALVRALTVSTTSDQDPPMVRRLTNPTTDPASRPDPPTVRHLVTIPPATPTLATAP